MMRDPCRIFALVRAAGGLEYLPEPVPATPEALASAAPRKPAEVFRLTAACIETGCRHFDGRDCRLASRIVQILPAAVDRLPACSIRPECRWRAQEGPAACRRCPAIATISYDVSAPKLAASGLPAMRD